MALDAESSQRLRNALSAIKAMTERGSVEPEWYFKALVSGAHECLMADDYERAIDYLGKVPPDYYETTLPIHMELDSCFAEKAFQVADALVVTGLVHIGFSEEERANVKEV